LVKRSLLVRAGVVLLLAVGRCHLLAARPAPVLLLLVVLLLVHFNRHLLLLLLLLSKAARRLAFCEKFGRKRHLACLPGLCLALEAQFGGRLHCSPPLTGPCRRVVFFARFMLKRHGCAEVFFCVGCAPVETNGCFLQFERRSGNVPLRWENQRKNMLAVKHMIAMRYG
jgi:hypothetical protein